MELKTLALDLSTFRVLQDGFIAQEYAAGWYVDPRTGQRIFYDPNTQEFYTLAGGVYIPLDYMNPAPKQVTLAPGDKLKITMSFMYSGPAISNLVCYYSIGVYGMWGFEQHITGQNTKNIPQYTTPTLVTDSYTFTIPSNVGTDWNDIYCKIYGGTPSVPQNLFGYENALLIVGKDPVISEFKISDFVKV